ncbi:hypothetical protein JCM6882_009306 [Rhodosporidiobolus microsporus]
MSPSVSSLADSGTIWPTASTSGRLSRTHASAYLTRLSLPQALLDAPPSLDLLRRLQSTHILTVPFESLAVHVRDWHYLDAEIHLGGGQTVALGEGAYKRIVELKRGGYCFSLNSTYAALLRYFGFRVSECAGRVFSEQLKDPAEVGWDWQSTSHQISIVDWEGSDGRWLSDVGFGRSCAYPIPLQDGAEATGIPSADAYRINRTDRFPGTSPDVLPDAAPVWTVYRRCLSPSLQPYWSPVYAFLLQSVPFRDFITYNHFQSTHPNARFRTFFCCTILHENGERSTLRWEEGLKDEKGQKSARFSRTSAPTEGKRETEIEGRWVEMKVGKVREILEGVFGMEFPEGYSGN